MSAIDFFYEFASTYSYLTAERIEARAADAGVEVRWRPFLLGPIFQAQGWDSSPFNIYPAKGAYMWRDVARLAEARGLGFVRPDPFPQTSLRAARCVLAVDPAERPAASRAIFRAEFADGAQISDEVVLRRALDAAGVDADSALTAAATDPVKAALRTNTDEAIAKGVFGAPSFVTEDGELFWGDDRLEDALAWASESVARRP